MKEIAQLLNDMLAAGVVTDYALFGALAQVRYTEPVATLDADVLVAVPSPERVDVLSPHYEYCARRGYLPRGEVIQVGDWPVRFIPAFSDLTREAMQKAETADFEGVPSVLWVPITLRSSRSALAGRRIASESWLSWSRAARLGRGLPRSPAGTAWETPGRNSRPGS